MAPRACLDKFSRCPRGLNRLSRSDSTAGYMTQHRHGAKVMADAEGVPSFEPQQWKELEEGLEEQGEWGRLEGRG